MSSYPFFSTSCRFNKSDSKQRSLEVTAWGSGVRVTTYVDDESAEKTQKSSVFLTDEQTEGLFCALAQQFNFEAFAEGPAPASKLARRVERIEEALSNISHTISNLLADNPF